MEPELNQNNILIRGSLFSVILFSSPLFFIFFLLIDRWIDIRDDIISLFLIVFFFLVYTGLLIAFFQQSKVPSSNQGYSLLIFLSVIVVFLIVFAELLVNNLNPAYSTIDSFIQTIQHVNSFVVIAFFLYTGSFLIEFFIVKVYGLLHKTARELRNNSIISLKVVKNHSEDFPQNLSFFIFNRPLQNDFS